MPRIRPQLTVLAGTAEPRGRSQIEAAYDHFRLDRQGNLVSRATLEHYDFMAMPFVAWLSAVHPNVRRFDQLGVEYLREFRAYLSNKTRRDGRAPSPHSVFDSHRVLLTFFRWAEMEGYDVDGRILLLKRPRLPEQEATVFHVRQLREILAACNPAVPQEEMAVRILVGSGLRASELCGLCLRAPDGLPDLMLDSLNRGRVELRVRWDAGAKGRKSRRIPITPKLAARIKRYEGRERPESSRPELLINQHSGPYQHYGIVSLMDRLQQRVGYRVYAHAFRHTFATVATKLGWNFERLRAAMGHSDYKVLQRYVRLATERDLGTRTEWAEFIVADPVLE